MRGLAVTEGTADLPDLLQRVMILANESTDTAETMRRVIADIGTTVGLTGGAAQLAPVAERDPGRWSFPVRSGDEVVATLSFDAPAGDPDAPADLCGVMDVIGRQLGIAVERDRTRAALEAARAELERSNRELEQFAYVASHDLQEPLRKIVGFSELLETRYAAELEGEAGEFLGYVTEGARRMARLIEDLLRYSRVGRHRPELRPTDLGRVLDTVIDLLSGRIADASAEVAVDGTLPTVLGDPEQLRDLLTNLVGNALKYHDETPVHVRVAAVPQDRGWWAVSVTDDGIGIDPVHAERIFEVFQRLHPRTRYEGSGIGLAICRRIVDHHGGRIWVESRPGEGSRFTFTVPAVPEDPDV